MRTQILENSYWNNKGTHQKIADKLSDLIPAQGEVENPKKNKALEKFRKASNVYYDIFNNGLFGRQLQRGSEFRGAFGFGYTQHIRFAGWTKGGTSAWDKPRAIYDFTQEFYRLLEESLDKVVLAAAEEQGLVID